MVELSDGLLVGLQPRAAAFSGATVISLGASRNCGADAQVAPKNARQNKRISPCDATWNWIVPHGLWEAAKLLVPDRQARRQGGGTASMCDEKVFAAILYVLVSGCAWRSLPPCFEVSKSTAHRRFLMWTKADVWRKLHAVLMRRDEEKDLIAFSERIIDSAHARTEKGANIEVREAWKEAERIPGCVSCRTRPDCAWSSVSQPPAQNARDPYP